ncbi:MAG: isoamylase early set domain-containing protein [Chloroflexota bacterium]|jgi:1,4-alpha-glucan branching enzyme
MLKKVFKETEEGRIYQVTFKLRTQSQSKSAHLLGEFNDWDPTINPMKRQKNGEFSVTVTLAPGIYRFRYLLDGERWENDLAADSYMPNEYGSEDSVVEV